MAGDIRDRTDMVNWGGKYCITLARQEGTANGGVHLSPALLKHSGPFKMLNTSLFEYSGTNLRGESLCYHDHAGKSWVRAIPRTTRTLLVLVFLGRQVFYITNSPNKIVFNILNGLECFSS